MARARLVSGALVLSTVAYVVSVVPGVRSHPGYSTVWEVVVVSLVTACGTFLCIDRAVRQRAGRMPWVLIAVSFGCYATGSLVFSVWVQPLAHIPYPSVADVLWLLVYPFALAAVVLAARARFLGPAASMWLD